MNKFILLFINENEFVIKIMNLDYISQTFGTDESC